MYHIRLLCMKSSVLENKNMERTPININIFIEIATLMMSKLKKQDKYEFTHPLFKNKSSAMHRGGTNINRKVTSSVGNPSVNMLHFC